MMKPSPKRPKITVITACQSQAPELARTISSVLSQAGADVEHIVVVSRRSTDDSLETALSSGGGTVVLQDDGDDGPEGAVNGALAVASGDVLAFLGAGDTYLPDALGKVSSVFAENPEVKFLSGTRMIFSAELNAPVMVSPMFKARWEHVLYGGLVVGTESVFWRRGLMDRVGARLVRGVASDYELWCRMLRGVSDRETAFVESPLSSFTLHKGQRSGDWRLLCERMRDTRDEFLRTSGADREASANLVVKWTTDVERRLVEFAMRNRQPYLFIPDHQIWFSGWPFEGLSVPRELPGQPDLLNELLPAALEKIRAAGFSEFVLCGAGRHSERLLSSGLVEKHGLSVGCVVDRAPPAGGAWRAGGVELKALSYLSDAASCSGRPLLLSSDVYEERMWGEVSRVWRGPVFRIYGDRLDWKAR